MALSKVTVTGTYEDGSGAPLAGTVTFAPTAALEAAAEEISVRQSGIAAVLNGEGSFSAELFATDNPDLEPAGWCWTAREAIAGLAPASWSFFLWGAPFAFTATSGSPCVLTAAGSGYPDGQPVTISGGSLPAGITAGTYYVTGASGDTFSLAATPEGSGLPSTGTGSGTVAGPATQDISGLEVVAVAPPVSAWLPLTGGTMSGPLVLAGNPAVPLGAAPRQYVDAETTRAEAAEAGLMPRLAQTPVKTGAYAAQAWQLVPVSTAGGAVTITLPSAPAAGTVAGVKMVLQGAANAVTVTCGGTDVINQAAGPASITLSLLGQGALLEYVPGSPGVWMVLSDDLPLSQLDARYAAASALTAETSRAETAEALALPKAGGTATGTITLAASPPLEVSSGVIRDVLTSDASGNITLQPPPADWINVRNSAYGATGNGTTDDTAAIQAALNAAASGQPVYFPAGTYLTSAPLTVPIWSVLAGPAGERGQQHGAIIAPGASFSGSAALILDAGSTSGATGAIRIRDLVIDGASLPAGTVHGILAEGYIHAAVLRGLRILSMTGDGVHTETDGTNVPYSWTVEDVECSLNGGHGFCLQNLTDSTWIHARSVFNGGDGWNITATGAAGANSRWIGCIAENNTGGGWNLASSTSAFAHTFSGCSTNLNGHHGFAASSTSTTGLIQISGCRFWADGQNGGSGGGGYAGISLSSLTCDVLISGTSVLTVNTGSPVTPEYGLAVSGCTGQVTVAGSEIIGGTTDISNGGSNTSLYIGADVSTGTGLLSSLTRVTTPSQPGTWQPADQGFLAWTGDPANYVNTTATVSQTLYLMKVRLRAACTVTNVCVLVSTAGSGFTSATMGLYNSAGTLLSSASAATALAGTGLATVALGTPQALQAGDYWVGLVVNGGGQPVLERSTGLSGAMNAGLTSGHYRYATNGTSVTTMGNITPGSNASGTSYWAGVS